MVSVDSPEVTKLEYPHIGDVLLQAIMETLTKTIGRKVVLGKISAPTCRNRSDCFILGNKWRVANKKILWPEALVNPIQDIS